ncbi:hypothetical protein BGZ70_007942 [Mortierella alpina]|uniref:Uncharacterized protein n=1 Tax=Mortierella alpina TaxID=64518 RepID=A0A9P6J509_MORAP|nr:hypothetical protein BGZ70_007942 [Mortierella alpina]
MALKDRVDSKTSLRQHFAFCFLLLLAAPLVTWGDVPPVSCSTTAEWKLPDKDNNTIPNFSRVGYREGHVQIPIFSVKRIFEPNTAHPLGDDTERIQAAIVKVGSMPLEYFPRDGIVVRGAVLLKKGVYRLDGTLFFNKSGVLLRGEGLDINGTTLFVPEPRQGSIIQISGVRPIKDMTRRERMKSKKNPVWSLDIARSGTLETSTHEKQYISVGTTTPPVQKTEGFNVHDKIVWANLR